jgi:GNAT superfamily N-acetyltransferase
MAEYALREVSVDDASIAQAAELLRHVFPRSAHFTDEAVRWQYRDNPDGHVVGFNAWLGEELAAHYVTIPLLARVNGREEKGLLSLNTATHPSHQGKGLFTQLAKATYERGGREGFGFVVGVANANSTHGFTKKLGFQLVSPLRAMIGIGALPWSRARVDVQYEGIWSERKIKWRLAHPVYRYTATRTAEQDLVLSERSQAGARYVVAALPQGSLDGKIKAPWRKVWIGLDPAMRWSGKAYMNIPMRLRPSPLNLIFKDLTGAGRTLDPARVRFQAIDFDIL